MYGLSMMLFVPIWTTSKNINKITKRQISWETNLADTSHDLYCYSKLILADDLKPLAPFGATAKEEIGETNELLSSSKETDFKQALRKFSETSASAPKEHRSNDAKNNEKGKPSSRLQLRKTDEEENLLEEYQQTVNNLTENQLFLTALLAQKTTKKDRKCPQIPEIWC